MTKTRRYIIARHGETTFNKERRVQGTIDESVLTDKGAAQASALGLYVSTRESITKTFCSPLKRCRQTYALVSEACSSGGNFLQEPTILDNLKEIELKEWQGRLRSEIMVEEKTNWGVFKANPCELRLQDGSFAPVLDCFERAMSNWEVIRSDAASNSADVTFIMCHGAMGQCMLIQALGLDKSEYGKSRRIALDNCECFEVEFESDDCKYASRWRKIDTSQRETNWQSMHSAHLVSNSLLSSR